MTTPSIEDLTTGNWRVRRPLVLATLAFCAAQLTYLTIFGEDTALAQTMAIGAFGLAGSTLGSYLFSATWDTKNLVFATRAAAMPAGYQTAGYGYPGAYPYPQPLYDAQGRPMAAAPSAGDERPL